MTNIIYTSHIYGNCKYCGKKIIMRGRPGGGYSAKDVVKVKGTHKPHKCNKVDIAKHMSNPNVAKPRNKSKKCAKSVTLYTKGNGNLNSLPPLPTPLKKTSKSNTIKPKRK